MLKILIVDDSEGWRIFNKDAVSSVFGKESVEITLANSAKEGYNSLLQNDKKPFDLILSDLQMESDFAPESAGEWFVSQVKNTSSYFKCKVLIISGMYNIEFIADKLGVDFISKRMLVAGGELPLKLKLEEMGFEVD